MQPQRLSVVIAMWPDPTRACDCLAALEPQRNAHAQVIAVSARPPPPEIVTRFPWVRWLHANRDMLVPELWALGMAVAEGKVVAITTGQLIPASDWMEQISAAHERLAAAGIGGRIDPPQDGSATDWATYFLRYSNLFRLKREQTVTDIAGDNASYKRAVLTSHRAWISEGFWEPTFHRVLFSEGRSLAFVPAIRVTQRTSFGIACFCTQRLHHGRHFGCDRMLGKSWPMRLLRITTVPFIPLLLLMKIVRRTMKQPSFFVPFAKALPVLLLFIVSWSLGEAWGYLMPGRSRNSPAGVGKHAAA